LHGGAEGGLIKRKGRIPVANRQHGRNLRCHRGGLRNLGSPIRRTDIPCVP
jgi:hypothetical protein